MGDGKMKFQQIIAFVLRQVEAESKNSRLYFR